MAFFGSGSGSSSSSGSDPDPGSGSGELDTRDVESPLLKRAELDMRHLEEYAPGQGRTSCGSSGPELYVCCTGLQESVQQELLRNPSGSSRQSLAEHPDVSVEAAQARFMVATNRSRSIAKEQSKDAVRLEHLQQNIAALPKEERKSVIKEIRKLNERMGKLDEVAAMAEEEVAKARDNLARALLRRGV